MARCERIRPLLYRAIEGEVDPAEAMQVARHLPDCTACKILLARKRRLAEMLEEDLVDVPVGEEFVRAVMSTLPEGPPPPRRRLKRGLKLAGLAGALWVTGQLVAGQMQWGGAGSPLLALPRLELESGDGGFAGLDGLSRLAAAAIEVFVRQAPLQLSPVGGGVELLAILGLAGLVGIATASAILAFAAGSMRRLWLGGPSLFRSGS